MSNPYFGNADASDGADTAHDPEAMWEVCTSERGRAAIEAIADHPDGIEREPLTDEVYAIEYARTAHGVFDDSQRDSVRIGLYQTHLPRLDASGIIVWDRDDDVIYPTKACDVISKAIEAFREAVERR